MLRLGAVYLLALAGSACGAASSAEVADAAAADAQVDAGVDPRDAEGPDAAAPEPRPLVHNALWTEVARDEDPFAQEPATRCLPDSYGEELLGGELVFYVRTDSCPSVTVRQGTRLPIALGDQLSVRAFHFPLTAPEPATARLILQLDDAEIFRAEIPIPSEQGELNFEWTAPRDFPRGSTLWFHVQNHGSNEYALIGVNVL